MHVKAQLLGHWSLVGDRCWSRLWDRMNNDRFFFGSKIRRKLYLIQPHDKEREVYTVKEYHVVPNKK